MNDAILTGGVTIPGLVWGRCAKPSDKVTSMTSREQRESTAQLLMVGTMLMSKEMCNAVKPAKLLSRTMGAVAESLQKHTTDESQTEHKRTVLEWLKKEAGVHVQGDERLCDALLRTVEENHARKTAGQIAQRFATMAANPDISDATFLRDLKREIAEVEA